MKGCGKRIYHDNCWLVCTNSLTNKVINECREEKFASCVRAELCTGCKEEE